MHLQYVSPTPCLYFMVRASPEDLVRDIAPSTYPTLEYSGACLRVGPMRGGWSTSPVQVHINSIWQTMSLTARVCRPLS